MSAAAPKSSKLKKILLLFFLAAILAAFAGVICFRHIYPYGWSHACSKGLASDLMRYAYEHEHYYPHGAATPEASLSLMYRNEEESARWLLGGKLISGDEVVKAMKRDGILSPATCGWNYVEGLRDGDDPEIAIAWDKTIGLDHHGGKRLGLMHEVIFMDGSTRFISKSEWPQFVLDQKARLEKLISSRDSESPTIRWSDTNSFGPNR